LKQNYTALYLTMYIVSTYAWLLVYQPEKTNLCHHYICSQLVTYCINVTKLIPSN